MPFPTISTVLHIKPLLDLTAHSRWGRLVRVTAYCMRFGNNLKSSVISRADRINGPLQPAEIEAAEEYWIRQTQVGMEIEIYPSLSPFVDDCGIISRLNGAD